MACPGPDSASGAAWPAWLTGDRVNDSIAGAAYEVTPPRFRAALKTGLALVHFHFGESLTERKESAASGRLGFMRAALFSPVPWALIVFSPAYTAAARLMAACAAARLSGVPEVAAICLGGEPQVAALVSIELSGVEEVFTLGLNRVSTLMDELAARPGRPGRVVLLHAGDLDELGQAIRARELPCYEERRPPRLRIEPGAGIDREILAFAHGGAAALEAALTAHGTPDAVYCSAAEAATPAPDAPLSLCPGCEGFWLHPGLGPEFFTVSRQVFAPWSSRASEYAAS